MGSKCLEDGQGVKGQLVENDPLTETSDKCIYIDNSGPPSVTPLKSLAKTELFEDALQTGGI